MNVGATSHFDYLVAVDAGLEVHGLWSAMALCLGWALHGEDNGGDPITYGERYCTPREAIILAWKEFFHLEGASPTEHHQLFSLRLDLASAVLAVTRLGWYGEPIRSMRLGLPRVLDGTPLARLSAIANPSPTDQTLPFTSSAQSGR